MCVCIQSCSISTITIEESLNKKPPSLLNMEELERQCPALLRFYSPPDEDFRMFASLYPSHCGDNYDENQDVPLYKLCQEKMSVVYDIFKCLDSKENWQDLIFDISISDCVKHNLQHLFASYIFRRYEKNDIDLETIMKRSLVTTSRDNYINDNYYVFILIVMIANKDLSDDVISVLRTIIDKYWRGSLTVGIEYYANKELFEYFRSIDIIEDSNFIYYINLGLDSIGNRERLDTYISFFTDDEVIRFLGSLTYNTWNSKDVIEMFLSRFGMSGLIDIYDTVLIHPSYIEVIISNILMRNV